MGVTTVVAGNCGSSALDVAAALSALRENPGAVNFATLIGHNTVRTAVMGSENRPPRAAELARMRSLVWKAMADGAVGFSTGLQYVPGTYAQVAEIIDLARVAANAGGLYASHMRNEGTELEQAVAETIRVGAATGGRVEISHLKVDSPSQWGASAKALALIDAARTRGIDVRADQYAYTAASSSLSIRFPSWALEGGAQMVYHFMSDDDVDRIMRHPQVSIASDSGVLAFGDGVPHPRGYGDNARVLGSYVRVRHVIPLEEAIRKMTALPASHFKFANRGMVKAGYAADLVVFDPKTVADTATFEAPHAYATGIPYVLVNGVIVVKNGAQTDARPGQVLANSVLEKR
jgi:N-acyl-D-amino-acid deacylase